MITRDELLTEGCALIPTIHVKSDRFGLVEGVKFGDEQRYLDWFENAQVFLYKNVEDQTQYEDFRYLKEHINPQNYKKIIAIINSLNN